MPAKTWEIDFKFRKSNAGGVFEGYNRAEKSRRLHWWKSGGGATVGSADSKTMGGSTDSDPIMAPNDSFRFAFCDEDDPAGGTIDSIKLHIIYSRQDKSGSQNQQNIASPVKLQNSDATCCYYTAIINNLSSGWWFSPEQTVATNPAEHGPKNFEFSLAIVVTYKDGAIRHYGYDPTMDVRF